MDMTKDIIDFTQKLHSSLPLEVKTEALDMHQAHAHAMESASKSIATPATTPAATPTASPLASPGDANTATSLAAAAATEVAEPPDTTQISALTEHLSYAGHQQSPPPQHRRQQLLSTGDLSPPPRPLTSNDVVTTASRLELDASALPKSHSLPASPNHMLGGSSMLSALPAALYEFGRRSELPHTRAPKPFEATTKPKASTLANQQFCLRWNNYQSNLTNVFDELLQSESFVDVTLACEGQSIKAHKMVLSACSPYFQALFYENPCQHPIVIMRDVRWQELKALMEFMYKGEINVCQEQINPLLKVAEMLKIRGLAEVNAGETAGIAAHPMVPEQRMTVFGEPEHVHEHDPEDDSEEVPDDDEDGYGGLSKRARVMRHSSPSNKFGGVSAMPLSEQRMRKRSRDGLLLEENLERLVAVRRSRSNTPLAAHAAVSSAMSGGARSQTHDSEASPLAPLSMTAQTIVRNPFASPNSHAPNSAVSVTSANSATSAANTAASATTVVAHAAAATSGTNGAALSSPSGGSAHQLTPHSHSAAAAAAQAAAALANSHHAHHPHHGALAAQQLAAQHQLHAAAQSHAAMATALGASLAAAAAGAGSTGAPGVGANHHDDMEIKPEIAEMIREEERAKMIEGGHPWMGGASTSSVADSYQYQLQSMWQKCWNTNQQNLVQQLRFRERGPLKSWRPEAMAEAIFSVLKEGLSLSQAARKFDIPYPTFVLYANRVHNMLGPSLDGGTDPRPKARGRPQRILLGMWPEELIRSVIKAVVFRDYREIKEDMSHYANGGAAHPQSPYGTPTSANGYPSKMAGMQAPQNASLPPPDSPSPLSTMTENLRRQIMSQQQQQQQQQQQLPSAQSMNMYKSPAYLQRSEIEDQVSAAAVAASKQQATSRAGADNIPDLSALGLMGIPGLNVIPTQAQRGNHLHPNAVAAAAYSRERDRERERERERDRELKEAMQSRQYSNQSRGSASAQKHPAAGLAAAGPGGAGVGGGAASPYGNYKGKEHPGYAYNKRFLESLPPGIDFEALANGLLQKSVNKSPRFEDFFPGQDMSELFSNAEAAAASAAYPPVRESPLMKIKLEQQSVEVPHED